MKYKFIDPKDSNFDPENPEIEVKNYGRYRRSELKQNISNMLTSITSGLKKYLSDNTPRYDMLASAISNLDPESKLLSFLKADLGAASELEDLRRKGGQRRKDIPKLD